MSTDKVSIVPVKLEAIQTTSSGRTPAKPICVIQANHLKISFYPDVKNYVIQTVIKELRNHDS
ncbi:hypothetical protein CD30_02855 [Ureibacillus massiliensis 4400831 = CIP 108448 = CCUG 49529]|uniref:Uncharacterized protein n=1 Tax=Ureibacillus massiliensis 4400831 = CIP 108448 = CCUG 49529 TaxID=1211035 RepID=A0A0A3J7Z2_9BACL|nr:hypothetical protein [Ureibacillus massiliensis]KGR91865.1 hypothetical protein CD30_02855 [Ureibacillus massiliensis 4400831 = CIP 108448 = CCUG 49529]BDH63795.1 hypothetical protein MTP04_39250 [Lysinibacillus sp. PLM2]